MLLNSSFFVLLFLIKLRYKTSNTINVIFNKYGREVVKNYRLLEKEHFRRAKLKLDIDFLQKCLMYEKFPKFLQFKTYSRNFRKSRKYREWQSYLLKRELRSQKSKLQNSCCLVDRLSIDFKNNVSFLDFYIFKVKILIRTKINCNKVKIVHDRKLHNLDIYPPNYDHNCIFNYSNRLLSNNEKNLLSLGLNFCIPFYKVDFVKHSLSFEKVNKTLESLNNENFLYHTFSIETITNKIKQISSDCFNLANRYKNTIYNPVFNKSDINTLKDLGNDSNIIITRPDKGRGVVLMNKSEYLDKSHEILNDITIFRKISEDLLTHITRLEDKLNRILKSIKNNIGWKNYNSLYASGSQPGIMYCLPKVHKPNIPLRPIISSINTVNYKLAKFLVPYLNSIFSKQYILDDSNSFIQYLKTLTLPNNFVMASFDIKSLFTNVPLKETTYIILSKLNPNHFYIINKTNLKKLLDFATTESCFLFNDNIYITKLMELPWAPHLVPLMQIYSWHTMNQSG